MGRAAQAQAAARRVAERAPVALTLLGLLVIVLLSAWLRTRAITAKFWIDEGLSVGIGHHPLFDIPGVLRQDGSPPLYYMVLHVWMEVVGGDGESRTHALSVLFALAAIPVGWWGGRALFGTRAGWTAAALLATAPFLTYYAQEARMYALVALLGLAASALFGLAYGARRRRAIAPFGVLLALLFYGHNWGLFLGVGLGAGFLVLLATAPAAERRSLLRDGVLGFGLAGLLYLPWVPTLLAQASSTGAPWSEAPPFDAVISGLQTLLGGNETVLVLTLFGIGGLLTLRRPATGGGGEDETGGADRAAGRAALGLVVAVVTGVLLAWAVSRVSPAWATRYFATFIGPLLLLVAGGLVRSGRLGIVALAIVLILWFDPRTSAIRGKSDAYRVAGTLREEGLITPGDVVLATHPEQGPLMRYYLGPRQRYADALGWVPDPQVFDWRDALERLEAAGPVRTLRTITPRISPGQRLILIQPIIRTARWGAPWTSLVRRRAAQWEQAVNRDPAYERLGPVPKFKRRPLPRGVRAIVYVRR